MSYYIWKVEKLKIHHLQMSHYSYAIPLKPFAMGF